MTNFHQIHQYHITAKSTVPRRFERYTTCYTAEKMDLSYWTPFSEATNPPATTETKTAGATGSAIDRSATVYQGRILLLSYICNFLLVSKSVEKKVV